MNSEDTVRQNLLMGCRQHQANITQHRPSEVCWSELREGLWLPCSFLRKLQSHPKASPEPGRGLWKFLVLGTSQLLPREGLPFSVHTGSWRRGTPLGLGRNLKRSPRNFPTALSISSQCLGCSRCDKGLDSTHAPHALGKSMFSSMGTGPQRGVFTSQGPRRI